jgi:hypothetical protein
LFLSFCTHFNQLFFAQIAEQLTMLRKFQDSRFFYPVNHGVQNLLDKVSYDTLDSKVLGGGGGLYLHFLQFIFFLSLCDVLFSVLTIMTSVIVFYRIGFGGRKNATILSVGSI